MNPAEKVMQVLQGVGDVAVDTLDMAVDTLEKASTPASRSGATVERVGKLQEDNVDDEVIALQMTKNSATKHTYSKEFVAELGHLYQDCKTNVLLTKKQTTGLARDQRAHGKQLSEGDEMGLQGA